MLLSRSSLVLRILVYGNWYFVIRPAVLLSKKSMHKLMSQGDTFTELAATDGAKN